MSGKIFNYISNLFGKNTSEEHEQNKDQINEENIPLSVSEQVKTEKKILEIFDKFNFNIKESEKFNGNAEFLAEKHYKFTNSMMSKIPAGYHQLNSGLPWFAYWTLNVIDMLNKEKIEISYEIKLEFVKYLKELHHEKGGFCGYSKGFPNIISSYAAVLAICILDIPEAYEIIDIKKMREFLLSCKNNDLDNSYSEVDKKKEFVIKKNLVHKDNSNESHKFNSAWPGSYMSHENSESDLRAVYCGLVIADILGILDEEITKGVAENIQKCQTFEGGLGPEPYSEAHGGYSFCGIGALIILNKLDFIDVERFIRWLVNKQMTIEGGFQGRTNKLVDSCYSTWQGGVFNMLINYDKKKYSFDSELLYDQLALQAYILMCCQAPNGGLVDKPGKHPDLFHTNYAMLGLALSQKTLLDNEFTLSLSYDDEMNFSEIDPVFTINSKKLKNARDYFRNKLLSDI